MKEASVATATQVQGKALSYNNIADTDAALECVKEFAEPACVIVKHANPCGVAIGNSILDAYDRAYKPTQPPHSAASLPLTASWMRKPHRPSFLVSLSK